MADTVAFILSWAVGNVEAQAVADSKSEAAHREASPLMAELRMKPAGSLRAAVPAACGSRAPHWAIRSCMPQPRSAFLLLEARSKAFCGSVAPRALMMIRRASFFLVPILLAASQAWEGSFLAKASKAA